MKTKDKTTIPPSPTTETEPHPGPTSDATAAPIHPRGDFTPQTVIRFA